MALGVLGDPIFSISHHRGITHSLVFAPVLALAPAALFYFWGKLRNFKILWLMAVIGKGIIDPFFTGILAMTLLLGKLIQSRRRQLIFGGGLFVVLYLSAEIVNHNLAHKRMDEALRREGIATTN